MEEKLKKKKTMNIAILQYCNVYAFLPITFGYNIQI